MRGSDIDVVCFHTHIPNLGRSERDGRGNCANHVALHCQGKRGVQRIEGVSNHFSHTTARLRLRLGGRLSKNIYYSSKIWGFSGITTAFKTPRNLTTVVVWDGKMGILELAARQWFKASPNLVFLYLKHSYISRPAECCGEPKSGRGSRTRKSKCRCIHPASSSQRIGGC